MYLQSFSSPTPPDNHSIASSDVNGSSSNSSALSVSFLGREVQKSEAGSVGVSVGVIAASREQIPEDQGSLSATLSSTHSHEDSLLEQEIPIPSNVDIEKLKELLAKIDSTGKDRALKKIAEIGLNEIQTIKTEYARCPSSAKAVLKLLAETLAFSGMCILAVINLLGVTKEADFSKPLEALDKLVVVPAALCTGAMYTGGAINLYERIEGWIQSKDAKENSGCLAALKEAIREQYGSLTIGDYFKAVVMIPVAIMSVVLDAKNTEIGIKGLLRDSSLELGTINALAKTIAVGNGAVEALLPLTTLPQLYDDITKPGVKLVKGTHHSSSDLNRISKDVFRLLESAAGLDGDDDMETKIREIISGLSDKEQVVLERIFKDVRDNTDRLTDEFVEFMETSKVSPNYKTRLKGLTNLVVEFATLTLSMWAISALVSSNQKRTYYLGIQESLNTTMVPFNTSTMMPHNASEIEFPGNNVGLEPFPVLDDVVNHISYAAVGAALHPYFNKTLGMFTGTIKTLVGGCDFSRIASCRRALADPSRGLQFWQSTERLRETCDYLWPSLRNLMIFQAEGL